MRSSKVLTSTLVGAPMTSMDSKLVEAFGIFLFLAVFISIYLSMHFLCLTALLSFVIYNLLLFVQFLYCCHK